MEKPEVKVYVVVKRSFVLTSVAVFVSLFIGFIASIQYANYAVRKSDQKQCDVIGLFNESYKQLPPSTDLGKKIASAMAKLETDFKCR